MQPVEPAQQPVSMHDTPHKHHGALPLVAAMLGIMLVLESVALGYVVTKYVLEEQEDEVEAGAETNTTVQEELEERVAEIKGKVPPLLYTQSNNQIYQIDRQTGAEQLVHNGETGSVRVFAVPQIGYDGRVFLTSSCSECDSPYTLIEEFNLKTKAEPTALDFMGGSFYRGAAVASPDGTKMATTVYSDQDAGHDGEIYIVNLMTGKEQLVGELGEGEYFSSYYGDNVLGIASGFTLAWQNLECVDVYIYQDNATDPTNVQKVYKETRNLCIE